MKSLKMISVLFLSTVIGNMAMACPGPMVLLEGFMFTETGYYISSTKITSKYVVNKKIIIKKEPLITATVVSKKVTVLREKPHNNRQEARDLLTIKIKVTRGNETKEFSIEADILEDYDDRYRGGAQSFDSFDSLENKTVYKGC